MACERLEGADRAAVSGGEALGIGERLRAGELAQHLAVARAGDVDLVEKGRDRLLVAREQLEALDRVVEDVPAQL